MDNASITWPASLGKASKFSLLTILLKHPLLLNTETKVFSGFDLKIGMSVMLIYNINFIFLGWIDGTIAVVFDVDEDSTGIKN